MDQPQTRQTIPVVIFCGGTGTRMKEETEFRPKPMVEIGGRPILWHIMKGYAHQGYRDFILALGYKGNYIKKYFLRHKFLMHDFHLDLSTNETSFLEENDRDDFRITFVDTGADTLTADRLLRVVRYLPGDQFMVTYGDGVSNVDLEALQQFHADTRLAHGVIGTVTGIHPKSKYGLVNHDDRNVVMSFTQYPRMPDYTNAGFMLFQKDFLNYCKPHEMIEDALIAATNDQKIAMYAHQGFWHCMDTIKDKEDLEKMWHTEAPWKIW